MTNRAVGILAAAVALLAALATPAGAQLASVVPNPVVTGPIAGVTPGDPSHDG